MLATLIHKSLVECLTHIPIATVGKLLYRKCCIYCTDLSVNLIGVYIVSGYGDAMANVALLNLIRIQG